jgi:hypothetical protein
MTFWAAAALVALFAFAVAMWLLVASGVRHLFSPRGEWGLTDTIVFLIVLALAIGSTAWVLIL